jgi:protein SCO1/2
MVRRVALVAIALVALTACGSDEPADPVHADDVDQAAGSAFDDRDVLGSSVGAIALPDVTNDGVPFTLTAAHDELLVVYFGFASCPDICPTTLSDLRRALEALGDGADRVEVAMVTIDPGRDTDEVMAAYLTSFIADGHALRTDDDELLRAAADAFGATFDVITTSDGQIEVSHTAYLYAVDDQGIVRIVWPFGAEPDRIAADLEGGLTTGS